MNKFLVVFLGVLIGVLAFFAGLFIIGVFGETKIEIEE
jgi:hypothetical protein